jgi:hypothetical protein
MPPAICSASWRRIGHFLTTNGNHTPVNVGSFDTTLSLTEFKLRHRAKN